MKKLNEIERIKIANRRLDLPPIGQRIVKTSVAVFLCLLLYIYRPNGMPAQAVIAAIVCMQPYMKDTRRAALFRITDTFIGAVWGLLFLLLMKSVPVLGTYAASAYFFMAFGVLCALYSAVLLNRTAGAGLIAIVYMCIIISWPNVEEPVQQTIDRLFDTFVGTVIAVAINHFSLPRVKHPERLFFVYMKDLVADRYAIIPRHVLYWLERLSSDGARICLISEHAPAFLLGQLGAIKLNVPLIVMDGAALYDINENTYPVRIPIPKDDCRELCAILDAWDVSYNVYAIHRRTMFIYNKGGFNRTEQDVYNVMKRSPYRNYIVGHPHAEDEVLFLKIIDNRETVEALKHRLDHTVRKNRFRTVKRVQQGFEGVSALYIYNIAATVDNMKKRFLEYTATDVKQAVEISLKAPYRSEQDAMKIMSKIRNAYEPLSIWNK